MPGDKKKPKEYGESALILHREIKSAIDKSVKETDSPCALVSNIQKKVGSDPRTVKFHARALLHGLIEQNPGLSMEKFIRFNLPELMKVKTKRKIPGERRRSYNCTLSVNARCIFCSHKKAGSWCLRAGILGGRCQKLVTMYERTGG